MTSKKTPTATFTTHPRHESERIHTMRLFHTTKAEFSANADGVRVKDKKNGTEIQVTHDQFTQAADRHVDALAAGKFNGKAKKAAKAAPVKPASKAPTVTKKAPRTRTNQPRTPATPGVISKRQAKAIKTKQAARKRA